VDWSKYQVVLIVDWSKYQVVLIVKHYCIQFSTPDLTMA